MASKSDRLAFLCLGTMGYPMAGHLARAGHRVRVYNRTQSVAEKWQQEYAANSPELSATPAEAVRGADAVFVCAGNDDDLRAVVHGDDGALAGMDAGALFVDHTTDSADVAREVDAAARALRLGFLDAPVSGGQAGAENGALTVMLGGEHEAFAWIEPWLDAYAHKALLMGPAGCGQLTKAVNQICIAGLLQALSEGLNFARTAGLDVSRVVEVISQGAAQSWQMDNRADTMAKGEFEFGFAVDWMRKDLDITLRTGRAHQARLPLTALVDQFYADVQAKGGSRWDTSSLITRLSD